MPLQGSLLVGDGSGEAAEGQRAAPGLVPGRSAVRSSKTNFIPGSARRPSQSVTQRACGRFRGEKELDEREARLPSYVCSRFQ
jgi:hypothetical protein